MKRELGRGVPQVSISSTFYSCLFCTQVLCEAFLYLKLGFVIFWRKNIITKTAHKMLMKLITERELDGRDVSQVGTDLCPQRGEGQS